MPKNWISIRLKVFGRPGMNHFKPLFIVDDQPLTSSRRENQKSCGTKRYAAGSSHFSKPSQIFLRVRPRALGGLDVHTPFRPLSAGSKNALNIFIFRTRMLTNASCLKTISRCFVSEVMSEDTVMMTRYGEESSLFCIFLKKNFTN